MAEGLEIALKRRERERVRLLWIVGLGIVVLSGSLAVALLFSSTGGGGEHVNSHKALEASTDAINRRPNRENYSYDQESASPKDKEVSFVVDLDLLGSVGEHPKFATRANTIRVAALNSRDGLVSQSLYSKYLILIEEVHAYTEEQRNLIGKAITSLNGPEFRSAVEIASDLTPSFSKPILAGIDPTGAAEAADLLSKLSEAVARIDAVNILNLVEQSSKFGPRFFELLDSSFPNRERDAENQTFDRVIDEGFSAVNSKKFELATRILQRVKELRPNDPKAEMFEKTLEKEMVGFDKLERIAAIDAAIFEKNYILAAELITDARSVHPDMNLSATEYENALYLVNLSKRIESLASKPKRLGDPAVLRLARAALKDASLSAEFGFEELAAWAKELTAAVELYSEEFSIELVSNGMAEVEVRGVGFISPFEVKRIELRRGDYLLISRCVGYADRLIKLSVPLSSTSTLRIECGKRI